MLHDAESSPDIDDIIMEQIKRFGGKLPERIVNKPKLAPGLRFFYEAFYDLDTERSLTELSPIAWSSIITYAEYYQLSKEHSIDLLYIIRAVDNAFLKHLASKRKKK